LTTAFLIGDFYSFFFGYLFAGDFCTRSWTFFELGYFRIVAGTFDSFTSSESDSIGSKTLSGDLLLPDLAAFLASFASSVAAFLIASFSAFFSALFLIFSSYSSSVKTIAYSDFSSSVI
jgi:hypothetical protein